MFFRDLARGRSQKTSPRVEFWQEPSRWPQKSPTHLFLANVVHLVGKHIYSDSWSGTEPSTELIQPLPETLNVFTPQQEQIRACEVLAAIDKEYRSKSIIYDGQILSAPVMSEAEWSRARQLAESQAEESQQSYRRYIDVCSRLAFEFKNGTILTATRGYAGGPEIYRSRDFWNTENIWSRFDCCQVDPNDFFSPNPVMSSGLWLFVESESLFARLSPPSPPQAEDAGSQEPEVVPSPATIASPGRPEKYDWPDFFGGAVLILMTEGRPESLRKFTARMLEWCSTEWGVEPSESQTREKLKKVWDRLPEQKVADNSACS